MKTITISNKKQPLLVFETQQAVFRPDGVNATTGNPEILLEAEGRVVMQESIAIEEMLVGNFPCQFTVTEDGEERMHSPFTLTLITLEPDMLVARLS